MSPDVHPDDEVLAALALDEDDVSPEERRHVTDCPRCIAELEELRSTIRIASSLETEEAVELPGAGVWDSVSLEVRRASGPAAAASENGTPTRGRGGLRGPATLLIAAACLVVGVVAGLVVAPESDDPEPTAETLATAELNTLTGGERLGTATVQRLNGGTDLTLSLKPVRTGDGFLEVWLLNRDLDRIVSVGVVGDTWAPSFDIPQRLLDDGYVVVDVSRESYEGGPEHSGDSVMRGTLDPETAPG